MREGVVEPIANTVQGVAQNAGNPLTVTTPSPPQPQSPDRMTQIVQQNPELAGTPDVFLKAMQGPQVNALNVR